MVAAATDDEIMECTADFGEPATVFEVFGHRLVDPGEFGHQGLGAVRPAGGQRRAGGLEFCNAMPRSATSTDSLCSNRPSM